MSNAASYKGFEPSLTVNDVAKSVKFYTEALGFEVADKHEQDGQLRFAMLKAGDAKIGVGQDDFAKGRDRAKGVGLRLWLQTTQDLNALAEQAKAAGVTLDSEVMELPWGQKAFALKDPDGYAITIAAAR
jgi:uncharacterized glyoxalase superfamily protein PhnB